MTVADLGSARWAKAKSSREVTISDALQEALRQVQSGEIEPKHVLIVFDMPEEGNSRCGYLSAGRQTVFESIGMLTHAAQIMSRRE